MKNTLKKAAVGVLCCAMLFGMTACGQKPKTTQTTVPTLPQQTQSSLAAVQLQGSEELKSILDGIEDNVFPGTAGCTLTAVPYTVRLLDWCKTAGVSESELRTAVNGWLQGKKDPEETLKKLDVTNAKVSVVDKGALDCTLKARVECAVYRSCGVSAANIPWGGAIR